MFCSKNTQGAAKAHALHLKRCSPSIAQGPSHQGADTPGKEVVALAAVSLVPLPVTSSSTEMWEPWLMILGVLQNALAYRLGPRVRAGFRSAPVRGPSTRIQKLSVDPMAQGAIPLADPYPHCGQK